MNRYNLSLFSHRRLAIFLVGLFLTACGGLYFLNVPVQTQALEEPPEQNLVNGRLAFSVTAFGPGPDGWIYLSNADGSGASPAGIQGFHIPVEPAWSPDGTKLLFVGTQTQDIYVLTLEGSVQANLTNTPNPTAERNPSWSALGKIAYERGGQIWTMNTDGSGQAQFTAITQASSAYPAWSPDGTKLAFVSNGIWIINADGTNEHRITMSNAADPSWSPDGSKLVFAKSGAGIWTINADGTNETQINPGISDTEPAWSPDGTKFAVRGSNGIYTMDTDGGNRVRIHADLIAFPQCCDRIPNDPAWQPMAQTPNTFIISGRITYNNLSASGVTVNLSGTTNAATTTDAVGNYQFSGLAPGGNYTVSPSQLRTYFTPPNRTFNNLSSNEVGNFEVRAVCQSGRCTRNGKIVFTRSGDLFTINPDGTGQTNITNSAATEGEPHWSPDGAKILFTSNVDGNSEIYRKNSENDPSPVNLTNNAASDTSPYYSMDGNSIVFTSNRDGNSEIYKMNADGSNQVRLTNNPTSDFGPAFSPDGGTIIFIRFVTQQQMKLFTMNADGSNQQELPNQPNFVANYYNRPSYSPDGKKIITVYGFDVFQQTLWTVNADGSNFAQYPTSGNSPHFAPDGTKVVYTCCTFDTSNRIRTVNADGNTNTQQTLTPSNTGNGGPHWQGFYAPRAPYDFDGDGRSDVSVFRASNGAWYILRSRDGVWVPVWGLSTDVLAPADYDGDLKTDVAVWRGSSGDFYILNSFDGTVRVENFGLEGDVPTGGDWDGDGKAEVAVFRGGAQGTFYYRASMGNPNRNITFVPWGVTDDEPVAGDYDGDGRTDAAVFRPSNGIWYVRRSSDAGLTALDWGVASDKLVPADYDADGKTDFAVFRDGVWYLWRTTQGVTAFQFGIKGDAPAPADFDGDGKADVTIYREGVWWILRSQSGTAEAIQFGSSGDKPVPAAFVR